MSTETAESKTGPTEQELADFHKDMSEMFDRSDQIQARLRAEEAAKTPEQRQKEEDNLRKQREDQKAQNLPF